jgi:hypothetical protein
MHNNVTPDSETQQKAKTTFAVLQNSIGIIALLLWISIIGLGVWAFFYLFSASGPWGMSLHDRINTFWQFVLAGFLVFGSLGRIVNPLIAERLTTLYNKAKIASQNVFDHWFLRLTALLSVLRGIVTLAWSLYYTSNYLREIAPPGDYLGPLPISGILVLGSQTILASQ